jgi:hypothetical protein
MPGWFARLARCLGHRARCAARKTEDKQASARRRRTNDPASGVIGSSAFAGTGPQSCHAHSVTAWIIALHPGLTWFWGDSLGWWEVLLFLLAAVLVRFAIRIASVAQVRGGLILAFGVPIILATLGYASITLFQLPPVGHSCPSFAPASACTYHPLIGESGPWVFLGLLAGIWLAYAFAVDVSDRRGGPCTG